MDIACGHCGFAGPLDRKDDVELSTEEFLVDGYRMSWVTTLRTWWCPACKEPTLRKDVWTPDVEDAGDRQVVYPTIRDNTSLPEVVRTRLTTAMKVKKIEPGSYAVGIGRMLEAVCRDQGAVGKTLNQKLNDLVAKDKLPKQLAEAAHELRELRNLGAHDDEVDVAAEDVVLIEALGEAILEYLYRAPAAVEAVRAGLIERRESERGST